MSKRSPRPAPPASPAERTSEPHVRRAAALMLDLKARDLVVLDLAGITDMTDFFLIASGTSDTHVRSVAQNVVDGMKAVGYAVAHTEGLEQGRWVVLDFVDFVVHVFHPTLRDFYQLERLWGDARQLPLESSGAA